MRYTVDAAWFDPRAPFIELAPYRWLENHRKGEGFRGLANIPAKEFGASPAAPRTRKIDLRLSPDPRGESVFFGAPLRRAPLRCSTDETCLTPRPRALSAGR